ncbi:MAG: hypothetical protein H8E30_05550 [Alphaproteobacteria bacterium]|nr:hypothetical protein [Alphaproteobacteria bacterium]
MIQEMYSKMRVLSRRWAAYSAAVYLLPAFCGAVFWLNSGYSLDLRPWFAENIPLIDSYYRLLDGLLAELAGPAIFTNWGYPHLLSAVEWVSGSPNGIFVLQFLLFFATSVFLYCRKLDFTRYGKIVAAIFFLTVLFLSVVMSFRWGGAILAFLLAWFLFFHGRKQYYSAIFILLIGTVFCIEVSIFLIVYAARITKNEGEYITKLYRKFEHIFTFQVSYKYWAISTVVYGVLLIGFSIIFWLNLEHAVERNIWTNRYVTLTDSILNIGQYIHPEFEGPATYPIWGYPILVAIVKLISGSADNIIVVQYILFILSSFLVYDIVIIQRRILSPAIVFSLLFGQFYYAMLLSAKWPDAIMAFLLLFSVICHYKNRYILALLSLALAYNFRAEALIFFMIYATYVAFKQRKPFAVLMGFLLVLPWSLFHFVHNGKFQVGGSNAGGVMYISLGQLPGNIWQRKHLDDVAVKFTQDRGIRYPWSLEGNALLRQAFMDDVLTHPVAFARKVYRNAFQIFKGGFYVWEAKDPRLRYYLMQGAKIYLLIVAILGLWRVARMGIQFDPVAVMILAQIALVAGLQYQPRHMSHVAALFVFLFLPEAKAKPRERLTRGSGPSAAI